MILMCIKPASFAHFIETLCIRNILTPHIPVMVMCFVESASGRQLLEGTHNENAANLIYWNNTYRTDA